MAGNRFITPPATGNTLATYFDDTGDWPYGVLAWRDGASVRSDLETYPLPVEANIPVLGGERGRGLGNNYIEVAKKSNTTRFNPGNANESLITNAPAFLVGVMFNAEHPSADAKVTFRNAAATGGGAGVILTERDFAQGDLIDAWVYYDTGITIQGEHATLTDVVVQWRPVAS